MTKILKWGFNTVLVLLFSYGTLRINLFRDKATKFDLLLVQGSLLAAWVEYMIGYFLKKRRNSRRSDNLRASFEKLPQDHSGTGTSDRAWEAIPIRSRCWAAECCEGRVRLRRTRLWKLLVASIFIAMIAAMGAIIAYVNPRHPSCGTLTGLLLLVGPPAGIAWGVAAFGKKALLLSVDFHVSWRQTIVRYFPVWQWVLSDWPPRIQIETDGLRVKVDIVFRHVSTAFSLVRTRFATSDEAQKHLKSVIMPLAEKLKADIDVKTKGQAPEEAGKLMPAEKSRGRNP